jgi:hypothetical protein
MAIPTVYRSDDSSAPVITGTAGALVTALDAILVNGYGSQSAAGWTAPYTGTNKRVYRQGSGPQHYLRMDDADARLARVVGYGSISDIDAATSSNPFPTSGQISGGLYCRKSVSADSTARPWICFATDAVFYLFIFGNRSATLPTAQYDGGDAHLGFGTLRNTRVSSDINASFLCASSDTSATSTTATDVRQCLVSIGSAAQTTLYLNGSYNQGSSASTNCYKRGAQLYAVSDSGAAGTPFPDQTRGAMMLFPFTALEPTAIARGDFPGLMHIGHAFLSTGVPPHLAIVTGRGDYTGRTFYMVGAATSWGVAIETSGNW